MDPQGSTTAGARAPDGATDANPANAPEASGDARRTTPVEDYWAERAREAVDWFRPWDAPCRGSLDGADATWFPGARLNVAYNCLDRHLEHRGERVALVWEGDAEHEVRRLTFRELHERTCRFANALKGIGVRRGDRVCLYLPAVPEAVVAMLACARIGAVHAVVYAGFSPDALGERLRDAGCSVVVTADVAMRAGRRMPLKANVDLACASADAVRRVVVVRRDAGAAPDVAPDVDWVDGRDLWYHELVRGASADCAAVEMDALEPLFVLHTSGSSGKPKGVVHAGGGYLVHVAATCRDVFGHRDGEVHWCAADLGWITAHGYAVYGPLANGTTTLLYEGVPAWPDAGRWWRIVERHAVNVLYTSPTALRGLKALGDGALAGTDRASLRLLGTVGEPLDAATRTWCARAVGDGRCALVDTWWQTETGGIVVASGGDGADGGAAVPVGSDDGTDASPSGTPMRPLPGLPAELVDDTGTAIEGAGEGELVLSASWPGQATTLWNDHERYVEAYLARRPGSWSTGDGARRDANGRWWLTGRLDDVLELAGRRVGAARIEALLIAHPDVAEAAVVASDGDDGRRRVQAWVRPMDGAPAGATLRAALEGRVRDGVGGFAVPERIRFAAKLPKTRSGKLMRRMLRTIAERELDDLGDTSTLADPGIVDALVAEELRRDGTA